MKIKLNYQLITFLLLAACTPKKGDESSEKKSEPVKMELVGDEVNYSTDSANMKGYIAYDKNDSTKKPGILVVHEWWGHNAHARERADKLAELGYVAMAVDMYGDGKQAAHPEDAQKFMMSVVSNIDEAKARFESAMTTLKSHPNVDTEKIGAIGFCFGGAVVLSMANAGYELDAVAAFHAGLGLPIMPDSGAVKAKILVANGADDPFVPAEQIEAYKQTMDAAGADYKYIAYEGAVHAFTNKGADEMGKKFEMPLAYNAAADSASWEEMKMLFASSF